MSKKLSRAVTAFSDNAVSESVSHHSFRHLIRGLYVTDLLARNDPESRTRYIFSNEVWRGNERLTAESGISRLLTDSNYGILINSFINSHIPDGYVRHFHIWLCPAFCWRDTSMYFLVFSVFISRLTFLNEV